MIVDALLALAGVVDRLLGWRRPMWGHPFDDDLRAQADAAEDAWARSRLFTEHEAAELLDADLRRSSPSG